VTKLTLTFDNGPHPATTDAVLAALAERGLPATFFVVGEQLRKPGGRQAAVRARQAGHWIGNHSLTHSVPLGEEHDPARAVEEIVAAQELVGELAHPDRLFRPFGGGGHLGPHLLSQAAVDQLVKDAYTVVLWNCVPRDWEDPVGWVDRALTVMADQAWTVLVLHDQPTRAMDRLPEFLDRALEQGAEPVQAFPDDCVPIRRGQRQWAFEHLVAD
jgi:peptidoglycan/xylan/chitin deacetylase (PgdA/CDA1 family)